MYLVYANIRTGNSTPDAERRRQSVLLLPHVATSLETARPAPPLTVRDVRELNTTFETPLRDFLFLLDGPPGNIESESQSNSTVSMLCIIHAFACSTLCELLDLACGTPRVCLQLHHPGMLCMCTTV